MQHRTIGNLVIVMLRAMAGVTLLLAGCGGQSAAPAADDATATAAAATIAAALNTPKRDDAATEIAATLTASALPAIDLPSPTPTAPPPPSATPAETATPIAAPPTATPVLASAISAAAPLQTPDIQVAAPPSGFQVIQRTGGAIDETEVWTSGSLYVLTSDLSITERGRLVIEPGVIVKFGRGVRIYVSGSLQATGSAANGVVFTSLTDDAFGGDIDNNGDMALPSPGDWNGLYFYDSSRDDKTVLSYVRIRYANEPISLGNAAPTLTNIQLEQNNVNGYALSSGNWTTSRWSNLGNPYVVQNDISLDDMSTLTIDPGVVIKFWRSRLYVSGVLLAQSSADAPITFTSLADDAFGGDTDNNGDMALPGPGNWNGLYFYDSSRDDKTALSYVRVRYAGEPIVLSNAAPTLTNIQLEQNNVNGYALSSGAWTTSRWSNLGNPYVVQNDISLNDMATLTIDPGVVLKFWRSRLYVSGVLLAQGSADAPITFTSLADDAFGGDTDNNGDMALPSPGNWNGLYFYDSSRDDKTALSYVRVRYAGEPILLNNAAPTLTSIQLEQNNVNGYALSSGAWTTSRWSNVGNPYVVQNHISLNNMATLTIDPGVVIKFWRSRLYVSGVLLAQGSAEQPLIFTSLADDTVGGDTDNNADAALPSPSDWNGLYFYNTTNSNKSVLRDAEVRYTQSAYTLADGAAPTIERVVVMP